MRHHLHHFWVLSSSCHWCHSKLVVIWMWSQGSLIIPNVTCRLSSDPASCLQLHFCIRVIMCYHSTDLFCDSFCVSEIRQLQITWAVMAIWMHWKPSKRKQICLEKWRGNMGVCSKRSGPLSSGCRRRCAYALLFKIVCIRWLSGQMCY